MFSREPDKMFLRSITIALMGRSAFVFLIDVVIAVFCTMFCCIQLQLKVDAYSSQSKYFMMVAGGTQ